MSHLWPRTIWEIQLATLAKTERAAYWNGELTNAHIPDFLDATWRGARMSRRPSIETQERAAYIAILGVDDPGTYQRIGEL